MFRSMRAAVGLAVALHAAASDSDGNSSVLLVADLDVYYIHVASLQQVAATEAVTQDRMELTIDCGFGEQRTDEMEFHKCSQSEWRSVMDISCSSGRDVVIKLKERDLHYHDLGELRLPKLRTWSFPVGMPIDIAIPLDVSIGPGDALLNHVDICLSDVLVAVVGQGASVVVSKALDLAVARVIKLSQKALRRVSVELGGHAGDEVGQATMGWLLDALGYVGQCWGPTALPEASYALTLEFTAEAPYPAAEPTPIQTGSQKFLDHAKCVADHESMFGLRVWHWALIGLAVVICCVGFCCCFMCK